MRGGVVLSAMDSRRAAFHCPVADVLLLEGISLNGACAVVDLITSCITSFVPVS